MKTKIFALVIFSILLNDDSKRFILGFNCGEEQILYANKAFNVRYSLFTVHVSLYFVLHTHKLTDWVWVWHDM